MSLKKSSVISIDIGSVAIGVVSVNLKGELLESAYAFHYGDIAGTLEKLILSFPEDPLALVSTGRADGYIKTDAHYDEKIALIAALQKKHPDISAALVVGGEKFALLSFDEKGAYHSFKANTSCAAGTGSFLDQQAGRLGFFSARELADTADSHKGDTPRIASRCAVFAKTDLIHAQQEAYSHAAICDGLCNGLARNIVDTLFSKALPEGSLLMLGGVAKNAAVLRHIEALTGKKLKKDPMAHLMGAMGAALYHLDSGDLSSETSFNWPLKFKPKDKKETKGFYPPLELKLSPEVEFKSFSSSLFHPERSDMADVEIELYLKPEDFINRPLFMGIDIGSTSTKAVLIGSDSKVFAGFYTRTQGKPLQAVCALFEAMDSLLPSKEAEFNIRACASTGSGRKFIGALVGADLILDEITAHAKAAYSIDPRVDTIIEIGGQDSKFITLKDGRISSSIMNNVCAAGTGSFIEEQAQKLGVPILDYAALTEGVSAPFSSDRCTVFMERDLNHYLADGYSVREVLASALHSVRENYLLKVASESRIGDFIFFQGATAKNRSLVAAFEQGLQKAIHVSPYCHLTGALGAALFLLESEIAGSSFKGINIYKSHIPIRSEICTLCTNHCKLSVAEVNGEELAYGFLCGRDYKTKSFVNRNKAGFSLSRARRKAFAFKSFPDDEKRPLIGLPAVLHLYEDLYFWKIFFSRLGFNVKTSETYKDGLVSGKKLQGAEFCAPVANMHGHIAHLLKEVDYVFFPFYFEDKKLSKNKRRQYCYYTQFAPALASSLDRERILRPVVRYLYPDLRTKFELYRCLSRISDKSISFFEVSRAWDAAERLKNEADLILKEEGKKALEGEDIKVLLLGRPYNVLPSWANKGIPEIFESLGVRALFQDMLADSGELDSDIKDLLDMVHWRYAALILSSLESIVKTEGLYPVFISAFKCSPDSFILDYAKALLEACNKPYLVLELDEHDSSVGYETRIEAAVRAFRNHYSQKESFNDFSVLDRLNPNLSSSYKGKTIVLPDWDQISCRLIAANLRREGVKVVLIEESPESIRRSLRFNTGQCLPVNAIAEAYVATIDKHKLKPADTLLWMMASDIACNIKLYPHHIKSLLSRYGESYAEAGVYVGDLSFIEFSMRAAFNTYLAYFFGGLLRKLAFKIRPNEKIKGMTDAVLARAIELMELAFLNKKGKEEAAREVAAMFSAIPQEKKERLKVAVFGDIYVRDNELMNQGIASYIESLGAELISTSYSDYAKMTAEVYFRKWFNEGKYGNLLSYKPLLAALSRLEGVYYRHFRELLGEARAEYDTPPEDILADYGVSIENNGESLDNLLKVFYLHKHNPDLGLFVQLSPAFCCASLITEAMAARIEEKTGIPVVSITYDGTGGFKNQDLAPYLVFSGIKNKEEVLKKAL